MHSVCTAAHTAEQAVGGLSDTLETPTPFAAADVIVHDDSGRLSFHYAIVEVTLISPMPASKELGQRSVLSNRHACMSSQRGTQEPLCAHGIAQRAPEPVQIPHIRRV